MIGRTHIDSPEKHAPVRTQRWPRPAGAIPRGRAEVEAVVAADFPVGQVSPGEWNDLVTASGGTVFQTYEWQSTWWKTFGEKTGGELFLLLFRRDDRIVGIAPLFRERVPFTADRRLRFIGSGEAFSRSGALFMDNGPSDYLDFIVDPGSAEEVGTTFREYLRRPETGFRSIDLVNLRESGPVMTSILGGLDTGHVPYTLTRGEVAPFIPLRNDPDTYIRSLGSRARRRMNRAWNVLRSDDTVRLRRCLSTDDLREMFPDLVRMHQQRWNRLGFPGLFGDDLRRRFHEEIAASFLRRGWLWFSALYSEGRCIAARLGFRFGGRVYDYLSGFDDESAAARKKPGMALLLAMYGDAWSAGINEIDLLRGDENFKFDLTSASRTLSNLRIEPETAGNSRGHLLTSAMGIPERALYYLSRERGLFEVQIRTTGWPGCVPGYLKFRAGRLMRKLEKNKTDGGAGSRARKGRPSGS